MNIIMCTREDASEYLAHGLVLCTPEEADQYLMHYRVGGEKKGLRRWQDENGRLTKAGYEHYAEMYGWDKRLKKAEKLQNTADKKKETANMLSKKHDEVSVKAFKVSQKNEKHPSGRRQAKVDRLNEESTKTNILAAQARLEADKAQKKASDYATKLQNKEDREAKYRNEDGTLNEKGINKYTYATVNPGEKKMNLLGRIKFGNDYANKFNAENKMKMTNDEYKQWEKNENDKFKLNNYSEKLQELQKKQLKLIDEDWNGDDPVSGAKAKELSKQIDSLIEGEYSKAVFEQFGKDKPKLVRDLTGEEVSWDDAFGDSFDKLSAGQKHALVGLIEGGSKYSIKESDKQVAEKRSKYFMDKGKTLVEKKDSFDEMSPEEKRKYGDEVLQYLDSYGKWAHKERIDRGYKVGEANRIEGFNDSREMEGWLVDSVYEKAGSMNAGEYMPGTNAAKVNEKALKTQRKIMDREDQIKAEIGYDRRAIRDQKIYQREAERLKKALEKDSVWKELDVQWGKDLDEVNGAILKDLGFADTPYNRAVLYQYGWYD